jgi:hypothetical protein
MSEGTARTLACLSRAASARLGKALDNHCPRTVLSGIVAHCLCTNPSIARRTVSEATLGAADICPDCDKDAACQAHARATDVLLAATCGVALATMRHARDGVAAAVASNTF